ncbi:MAG: prepilin peptidase [Caldimicrobium sp.]|nr:prepilin peptidase [Caldimicrobium sp.]MCX7873582.1 prepilin peptidase [Caldimicrobium sp.]MDW8094033.1 prepilin peptidase [Caldimicrobium sp.]
MNYLLIFLFGLILGSFLNVVIYRIPQGESIIIPPSKCPNCKTPLKWYHNLPLVSYVLLRGKCAFCKTKISWHYPLVEILTATLLVVLYYKFYNLYGYSVFLAYTYFVSLLIGISFIDLFHREIPDLLSFPLIFGGWLFSLMEINPFVSHFFDSLISAFAGMGLLFFINEFYYLFAKRDGMGMGDFKLMGGLGAFLGYKSFFSILFFSTLIALMVYGFLLIFKKIRHKELEEKNLLKAEIPYGPFLSLSALLYLFYPQSPL